MTTRQDCGMQRESVLAQSSPPNIKIGPEDALGDTHSAYAQVMMDRLEPLSYCINTDAYPCTTPVGEHYRKSLRG